MSLLVETMHPEISLHMRECFDELPLIFKKFLKEIKIELYVNEFDKLPANIKSTPHYIHCEKKIIGVCLYENFRKGTIWINIENNHFKKIHANKEVFLFRLKNVFYHEFAHLLDNHYRMVNAESIMKVFLSSYICDSELFQEIAERDDFSRHLNHNASLINYYKLSLKERFAQEFADTYSNMKDTPNDVVHFFRKNLIEILTSQCEKDCKKKQVV